ncbi:putative RNA-directed DNA polymerase from transposon X-element [Trichonephila clavipes]|nr:putative RNA-directed DNA polymerase from transposon X-element [Trichonephila clavipes]
MWVCTQKKIVDIHTLQELKEKNITLSDLEAKEHDIELLLGADVIGNILTDNSLKLSSGVTVVQTKFGYTVIGKTNTIHNSLCNNVVSLHCANFTVTDLWNLDVIGITDPTEDAKRKHAHFDFLNQFKENLSVLPDGRYQLPLPFKFETQLPNNKSATFKRHQRMCQRIDEQNLLNEYEVVFRQWEDLQIIEEVPKTEVDNFGYYLPHRPVMKQASQTMKIRPVFDASARDKNHLLENSPARFDDVTQKLKHSFYVDNCLTGVTDIKEQESFINKAIEVIARGCFNLQGWESNVPGRYIFRSSGVTSLLGLLWDLDQDTLKCNLNYSGECEISKRNVLAMVHKIFDPLGILSPTTLLPKVLLQAAWWEGPSWLLEPPSNWPIDRLACETSEVEREKKEINYSFCLVDVAFCGKRKEKREFREIGDLTIHEIEHAEKTLIKIVQAKFFPSENSFPNMNVITDEEGIKRVKTRITERSDHPEFIYPIILPGDEPVSLPDDRVNDAAVFEVVGVDLAGPLYVKGGQKSWIVLFTCATYRAVHLELTSSLSTDAFLLSLRRFIARRGRPRVIYSDNGTNFRGAHGELSAAWWGGWWERLVRVLKELLRRTLGNSILTIEELQTVLCDCESVINSRPLTYLSENSDDLVPLSPAMFLVENRNLDVPDIDYRDTVNLRKRVIRLIPGKNGKIRTVELKTHTGTMLRPIQRVYPLEVQSTETPNDPLNDWTITNPISSISSDNLSDPNDSSNVLPRVSKYGRVIKVPEKLDLLNQVLYVFESK